MLDNFLYRAAENGRGNGVIKTIVDPQYVAVYGNDHFPTYILGRYSIDENGKRVNGWRNVVEKTNHIRINHYFTKSKEEWIKRRSIGKADSTDPEANKRTLNEFYQHDNNDLYDDSMLYYVEKMKQTDENHY